VKSVREDPDLKSVFEAVSGGCPLSGPYKIPDYVDASMAVVWPPSEEAGSLGIIGVLTIYRVNFDREAMAEQPQDSDFAGDLPQVTPQDYLGVELSVSEAEEGFRVASASIDEATTVFGEETGVKAVLDIAKGLTTPPFADLGAALPHVFFAIVPGACNYEAQGCTAEVSVGLAKGPEGTISVIQLYQFENAEMAVDALPAIRTEQEEGGTTQVRSVRIVGDTITQEGRFVKVEGALPIEDLSRMFE
jgi:hypothetical protein